jgi:hypothetical protein
MSIVPGRAISVEVELPTSVLLILTSVVGLLAVPLQ